MYVTLPNHLFEDVQTLKDGFPTDQTHHAFATRTVPAGHFLFREGDESCNVYEIIDGVVRASKLLGDGRRQIIAFGYPRDILGISHDCRYHSDCEAISEVTVRVHRKNACSEDVCANREFGHQLLKHTAREINSMQEHFMMLGCKSAQERVASFLIVLMDRVGEKVEGHCDFDLPMCRADIADFLGLTIETVSRSLTKLKKSGVIDLPNPHRVNVLKVSELRALAEESD